MRTKLLFLLLFGPLFFSFGQAIQIDKITPTAVSGGVNVHLVVTTFNGAGYLSNSYTVAGNTIELSVCYWFSPLLPVFQMANDFFIPVTSSGNYTINVSIFHSASTTVCDFFAPGPTGSTTILATPDFDSQKRDLTLFPNPTSGKVEYLGNNTDVKNIQVFDHLGRLVKQIKNTAIDLTDLSEGMYLIKMETENASFTQKVVVKK